MPENKNIEVVMQWINAANAHNVEQIGETLHPDYEYDYARDSIKGKDEVLKEWKWFLTGFPDLHYEVEQLIDSGEYVVSRLRMTGTQKGEFRFVGTDSVEKPIPATNKPIDIPGCSIHKIKDGKIIRLWRYWDSATMLRQIGLMK